MMFIINKAESDLGRLLYDDKMIEKINYDFLSKSPIS